MSVKKEQGVFVGSNVVFEGRAHVGFNSCVGYGPDEDEATTIGDDVEIGAFCIIGNKVVVNSGVRIDHYCQVAYGATIGEGTKILYRAQIFDDVSVGRNCIIAGELVDRVVVGDYVTFQGDTVHSHKDPNGDWETTVEPSPVIKDGSVVGFGAIVVGGVTIGPQAVVAAGEVVKSDVPEGKILAGGKLQDLKDFRGLIRARNIG